MSHSSTIAYYRLYIHITAQRVCKVNMSSSMSWAKQPTRLFCCKRRAVLLSRLAGLGPSSWPQSLKEGGKEPFDERYGQG